MVIGLNVDLYKMPLKTAFLVFPFLSLIFTVPYMIFQYRKNDAIVLWRTVVIYAFIYYLLTIYFLVILPLPSRSSVAAMTGPEYDLRFFHFVSNWRGTEGFALRQPKTWYLILDKHIFWEPFYNVLMTIPFGVFLRYYFKRTWWETLLYSFSLSMFFELTQLSGLYGLYPRPYRLFQVDDLILNTTGGLIGFILTPLFVFMFPTRDEIEEKNQAKQGQISLIRRGLAFLIDWGMIAVIGVLAAKKYYGTIYLHRMIANPIWYFKKVILRVDVYYVTVFLILLFFVLIPNITKGYTIGKAMVKIRIVDKKTGEKAKFWQYLVRSLVFYLVINILYILVYVLFFEIGYDVMSKELLFIIIFVSTLLTLTILYDFLYYLKSQGQFLNERLSKTKLITNNTIKD